MGLSSSQARLLTLTARMHDIEYKAQKLEAQKLQLANKTRQVYEEYLNALEMTKIQNRILTSDGSTSYVDSTYNSLIGKKLYDNKIFILRDLSSGKVYVDELYKGAYDASNKTLNGFLRTLNSIKSNDDISYISITDASGLMAMSGSSGNFRLDNDIELTNWNGISNFKGIFDGNGHTITIKGADYGLFKSLDGATVRNLNIDAEINTGKSAVGALAGAVRNSNIENVGATGNITASYKVGGLIGYTKGDNVISNCSSDVNVYSNFVSTGNGYDSASKQDYLSWVGGLIGYSSGGSSSTLTVSDSVSTGDVKSEYWFCGGFIGYTDSNLNLTNCESSSNVLGNCSGHGDDFAILTYSDGVTRYIPYVAAFTAATLSGYNINVTNCNSTGTVNANGDPGNTDICDFGWFGNSPNFTNYYSSVNAGMTTIPAPNVYEWSVDASEFENLTEDDFNEAVAMFNLLNECGGGICVPENCKDSTEWLSNVISEGFAMLGEVEVMDNNSIVIYDTSVAVNTNLQEVENYINIRKCEAKYEADMKRIDLKDRKYDTDLCAIENERNAIKQEIETLKTVAKENTERTIKLFG